MILSYYDDLVLETVVTVEVVGQPHTFNSDKPHRWSSWAAPKKADGSSYIAGQVDGAWV